MKTTKTIYWISTGLVSAAFLMSSIMYLGMSPQLTEGFSKAGIPLFFIPFLGLAKLLGSLALLNPWYKRVKEWAYAGFTFVLLGATWVHISTATSFLPPLLFLAVLALSYVYNGKLNRLKTTQA